MKTKQLATVLPYLLARIVLWAMFVMPVWVVGGLLPIPELVFALVLGVANLAYFRFQEDLVERIVPRFSVAQLNGR